MSTYVFAAAVTACLFAAFAAFFRKGCGDPGCGTHARCGGCPNATSPGDSALDSPARPEHHHA